MSVSTDLDTSVAQALLASRIVGKRASYTSDNPTEAAKVIAYLNGGLKPTSVATAMGKHLVALEDARRGLVVPPVPPVPPVTSVTPIWDGRAISYSFIGSGQDSIPAGLGCIFLNDDIIIQDSPRWGKEWRVRLNVHSKNPNWDGETANSAEIVTWPKRPLAVGQVDWFAQSFFLPSYLDTVTGWTILSQFGYPTLTSPPGSIILVGSKHWSNSTGVPQLGFEHNGGEIAAVGDAPPYKSLKVFRPVSTLIGKRVDVVVGYKWAVDAAGFAFFESRVEGEQGFTINENTTGIPTAEKLASEPLPLRDVMDKQGGYQADPLASWPAGWEQTYSLRGLTRHATRADAEASL